MQPAGRRLARLALLFMAAPALSAMPDAACRPSLADGMEDLRIVRATWHEGSDAFQPPLAGALAVTQAFCRLEGMIEAEIGFELWLPARKEWNGKLLTGGVGGQAGNFNYRELSRGLRRGYASTSTDTGHKASERHWLLGRPDRAANYAHRANHLLAVKSKALVQAYFGTAARKSYFVGCSGAGRQALTEAQRYPEDHDGIIAGAPGVDTPAMSARRLWEMLQHSRTRGLLSDEDWALASRAAIAHCDAHDGLRDGQVENSARCRFDPAQLACSRTPAGERCLSDMQVAAIRQLHAPLHDEQGKRIDEGLLPGVRVRPAPAPEPFTPGPPYLAVALFGDGVHGDAHWDAQRFRLDRDLPAIDRVMDLWANDPNLAPFHARGGRLLLYQGWLDPLVAAQPTIAYVEAVQRRLGVKVAQDLLRLYMVPGMDHCTGGDVPDQFGGAGGDAPVQDRHHDLLSVLEDWVERGVAPGPVIATQLRDGMAVRTRPLCPWPQQARYRGRGSIDDAASFHCTIVR